MNLVLFTSTYPFDGGGEQTFLDPELQYLCRVFESVVLVPKKIVGECVQLPDKVVVDESYASLLHKVNLLSLSAKVFGSGLIYRELFDRPSLLLYPGALMRMARFLAVAKLTCDWTTQWLKKNAAAGRNVFYTYWFDTSTLGIGLAKQSYPQIRLVSRVHGYDLYEEPYYHPPYFPFRRLSLSLLEALFPDAQAGLNYLTWKYPEYSALYEPGLLGVTDPGFITSPSTDGVFRIISCSMLVPVKRVDLLLEGILCAAQMRPDQQFEWTHIGNGDTRNELQERADRDFPPNAKASFPGYSNQDVLMDFYRKHPLDVFMNVSSTEGTPVAVMEAISCGVPVIATAVGGNQEIVSDKNGILLNSEASPEDIAKTILNFLDHPEVMVNRRKGSRAVWMERYNAEVNFSAFAKRLKAIGEH